MTICAGCNEPLPPSRNLGRPRKWCSDRCRKVTMYSRPCKDCDGAVTNPAVRCRRCNGAHTLAQSREWFFSSVEEWVERFGTPPSAADWNPAMARNKGMTWKAERYAGTGRPWPSPTLVIRSFGTWNAGLDAAGYPPIAKGIYRDGRSLRDIASRVTWDRAAILDAVERWREAHGTLPTSFQWQTGGGDHPVPATVYRTFESWGAMCAAFIDERIEGIAA